MRSVHTHIENAASYFRFYNEFWNHFDVVHGGPLGGNWWPDGSVEPRAEGHSLYNTYINWSRM